MRICLRIIMLPVWLSALLVPVPVLGQADAGFPGDQRPNVVEGHRHMPESLRTTISSVVVIAERNPADEEVTGTYERGTYGLMGGMAAGSRLGRISKQVGPVPIVIPIPILTIPGAIFGALTGAAQREIQEFRDALAEELIEAESPTLTDDGLALDVFWRLRKLPALNSKIVAPTTEVPEDTDALLYVKFSGLEIDIQGKEAIITTSAQATLRDFSNDSRMYQTEIRYQDRDELRNWTANDNALWRDYVNFARHYLGRAIAADVFDQILLEQALEPLATDSAKINKKNRRELVSRTTQPTLAWQLTAAESQQSTAWQASLEDAQVVYDLEIYDEHEPVYMAEQVAGSRHSLTMELAPCKTYRWSVRPSYRAGNDVRYGEWLRLAPEPVQDKKKKKFRNKAEEEAAAVALPPKGLFGRQASVAPAYTQDFPLLTIACGKK